MKRNGKYFEELLKEQPAGIGLVFLSDYSLAKLDKLKKEIYKKIIKQRPW